MSSPSAPPDGRFHKYRIVQRDGGFEPQMLYQPGVSTFTGPNGVWFPLNSQSYWLEPEAFSLGNVTRHAPLPTREEAERAIARAKIINAERHIISAAPPDGSAELG